MNFKADWSFLEKISMGAVSSKEVVRQLNSCGHNVIELERYSTSNKIWSTKIKRLRLPDLICLKCGCRIESRAKSKLDVRMSDNENNGMRAWVTTMLLHLYSVLMKVIIGSLEAKQIISKQET